LQAAAFASIQFAGILATAVNSHAVTPAENRYVSLTRSTALFPLFLSWLWFFMVANFVAFRTQRLFFVRRYDEGAAERAKAVDTLFGTLCLIVGLAPFLFLASSRLLGALTDVEFDLRLVGRHPTVQSDGHVGNACAW